eukprot:SAG31_NODE_1514_length_8042_cov_6.955936_5_plen_192_part_00
MRRFSDAFNAGFDRMCGPFDKRVPGQRGASERNQMAYPGLQLDPIFAHEFLDDPAVLHACRLFLGDGCILVASDAQRIEAETHWHADTPPEVDYQMMKCIMYLDEHGDGCGSVALLPGSHHYEFACRAVETAPSMREKLPGAVTACTHPGVRDHQNVDELLVLCPRVSLILRFCCRGVPTGHRVLQSATAT